MPNVVFVMPFQFETSMRFLARTLDLPGVRCSVLTQEPLEKLPQELRGRLAGHWRVDNALDAGQLARGARGIAEKQLGGVDRMIGVLEQLQVPLAEARAALGLPGLSPEAATNFRDKGRMKDVLRAAKLPCARHCRATSVAEVKSFMAAVGFPVVMKPPAGAGAVNTFRISSDAELGEALAKFPPNASQPMLLEEFIQGEECSFDSVWIGGKPVWHSISRYSPGPLEVMHNDWIQWTVLLPRRIDGPEFAAIRDVGPRALAALGMTTGFSHMEWFKRGDGSVAVSEVGARPPGAQFTTLMGVAHDTDLYSAWARLSVFDEFKPPERKFAAGAAYLRGQGRGSVKAVHGLELVQREMGNIVVEAKLPKPGQPRASSYEGEGYVILRHPETAVVEHALKRLVSTVRVELA